MRINADRLRGFLDCMHLEADHRDKHTAQIRDIVKAAKEAGYDPKAVRKVFVRERMDHAERDKQDDLLESYEAALGPKGAALRAIEAGATLDEAAEASGLGRATVARARAVSRQGSNDTARVSRQGGNDTPPHNPETGEVINERTDEVSEPAADREGSDQGSGDGVAGGPVAEAEGRAAVARQLRGQLSASTDPGRLQREIQRLTRADASDCEARDIQESCGGVEGHAEVGSSERDCESVLTETGRPLAAGIESGPHDTHSEAHHDAVPEETNHPLQDAPPAIQSVCAENAPTGDTRGEATPNADGMDILPFLRRPRERVMA